MGSTPEATARSGGDPNGAPSISSLLKRLGNETGELVRAEVALAKLEFRDLARQAAVDGAKVGAAAALALVGAIALAAAGVLVLGDVLGGHFAAAAAILGVLLLAVGGLLARSAARGVARVKAAAPLETIRRDGKWAAGELRGFRQELQEGTTDSARAALQRPEGRQ